MYVRIKSPAVARRVRGLGASCYLAVGAGIEGHDVAVANARHFAAKGLDFDRLCAEGRIRLCMPRACAPIVTREMERQARINAQVRASASTLASLNATVDESVEVDAEVAA